MGANYANRRKLKVLELIDYSIECGIR